MKIVASSRTVALRWKSSETYTMSNLFQKANVKVLAFFFPSPIVQVGLERPSGKRQVAP